MRKCLTLLAVVVGLGIAATPVLAVDIPADNVVVIKPGDVVVQAQDLVANSIGLYRIDFDGTSTTITDVTDTMMRDLTGVAAKDIIASGAGKGSLAGVSASINSCNFGSPGSCQIDVTGTYSNDAAAPHWVQASIRVVSSVNINEGPGTTLTSFAANLADWTGDITTCGTPQTDPCYRGGTGVTSDFDTFFNVNFAGAPQPFRLFVNFIGFFSSDP